MIVNTRIEYLLCALLIGVHGQNAMPHVDSPLYSWSPSLPIDRALGDTAKSFTPFYIQYITPLYVVVMTIHTYIILFMRPFSFLIIHKQYTILYYTILYTIHVFSSA